MDDPVWRMCMNHMCAAEFAVNVQRSFKASVEHCPFCGGQQLTVMQGSTDRVVFDWR